MAVLTQFPLADRRTLPSSPGVSADGCPATSTKVDAVLVPGEPSGDLALLKEKLLMMASYAETAVNRAVKALARRDDDLASRTSEEDDRIDRLELEVDELALQLLATRPGPRELRFVTMAMKIANNLERVGDEATTISRRVMELSREPQLQQACEIPPMAATVLGMLKDSLDSFVRQDPAQARGVIPRDDAVDELNRRLHRELGALMAERPAAITRALNLMVISKSLERIGDHAANLAEQVVYLCEGRDIRHESASAGPASPGSIL
ncbi:MAG TPA: phosphate signaling complex protein PhoU [Verrucomicrobiae bacterium]|nr:phosphate signaling complex protein PhoU [Verrucomicrobiae bacterium]